MGPPVWSSPPVQLFILGRAGSFGVLAGNFSLEGFDLPLDMEDCFCQCVYVRVLGSQVVGVFGHMGREVHDSTSEVIHYHPFLRFFLGMVGKHLLYPNQIFGSVTALARCLMALSEIVLGFDEVGLEGHQGFGFLCPPCPTIFWIPSCLRDESIRDADNLSICDWLSC